MLDLSCKKEDRYSKHKWETAYSFKPENFFNSLSSNDLKDKNIRALVYSVYRDFNLSKICISIINWKNDEETLKSYDSIFYDLINKFPYNAVGEDELEQLIGIGIIAPENFYFASKHVEGVELINRWYSIDYRKLLKILAVAESDSIDKFKTLIDKMKSEQSFIDEVDKSKRMIKKMAK